MLQKVGSYEIKGLVRYRLDQGTIQDIENYVSDTNKFQILDSNCNFVRENDEESESK